jgi:dihydroneopterin aldolase
MVDRDFVSNLCILGRHGVLAEATKLARKLFVDIDCAVDPEDAPRDDDYSKAFCRGALFDLAAEVSQSGPFMPIEAPRRSHSATSARSIFVRVGDLRSDSPAFSPHRLSDQSRGD